MLRRDFIKNIVVLGGVALAAPTVLYPGDSSHYEPNSQFRKDWIKNHPVWPDYLHRNQWETFDLNLMPPLISRLSVNMVTWLRIEGRYFIICREKLEMAMSENLQDLTETENRCFEMMRVKVEQSMNWDPRDKEYMYKFPEWAVAKKNDENT